VRAGLFSRRRYNTAVSSRWRGGVGARRIMSPDCTARQTYASHLLDEPAYPVPWRPSMQPITRRRFMQTSALLASAPLFTFPTSVLGANDRLRVAVVGLNGRGGAHIGGLLGQENVEVAALVDPDQNVLARTVASVEKRTGKAPAGHADLRRVLEDK